MDVQQKRIVIKPYDLQWPAMYCKQKDVIIGALGKYVVSIDHVGSTSVPGLAAKPKIDIIVAVTTLNFAHDRLEEQGYEYRGGFNIPLRKSFRYRSHDCSVNLHIFEQGDPEIMLNILFRDYLREHVQVLKKYQELKYRLIKQESSHQFEGPIYKGYTLGKHQFINEVIYKAGFKQFRFLIAAHREDLEAIGRYREQLFGQNNSYAWTLKHPDHYHFILSSGIDIVAYAHVERCISQRAVICFSVVDAKNRDEKKIRNKLFWYIEKWFDLCGGVMLYAYVDSSIVGEILERGYRKCNDVPSISCTGHGDVSVVKDLSVVSHDWRF